jgi:hypothetical protein
VTSTYHAATRRSLRIKIKNTSDHPTAYLRKIFRAALKRACETFPSFASSSRSRTFHVKVRGRAGHYVTGRAYYYSTTSKHTVPNAKTWTKSGADLTLAIYWLFLHELWHNAGLKHRDYPRNLMRRPDDHDDPVYKGVRGLPPAPGVRLDYDVVKDWD